jgi:hypothetical protein
MDVVKSQRNLFRRKGASFDHNDDHDSNKDNINNNNNNTSSSMFRKTTKSNGIVKRS